MSRSLKLLVSTYIFAAVLVFAPSALAVTHNGEGIWGPTNDVTIMDAIFITMGFFVAVCVVFSLLQSWLEKRHYAKLAGNKPDAHSHH